MFIFHYYIGTFVFLDNFSTASIVPWTLLSQSIRYSMRLFSITFMTTQLDCQILNGKEDFQFIFVSLSFTTIPSVLSGIVSPRKRYVEVLTTRFQNVILFYLHLCIYIKLRLKSLSWALIQYHWIIFPL